MPTDPVRTRHHGAVALDYGTWDLLDTTCLRCETLVRMPFRGLCDSCRDALHVKFAGEAQDVGDAEYDPKMNVTPNAVALKDD